MAKLNVNIGLSVNDKTGDTLRTAFDKINQNFTELYTLTGGTSTALTELAQDYAAPLFNHASHTNITVTYDDANNKILLTGVAAQIQSDWTASSGLGVILNKPTIPGAATWPVINTAGASGPREVAIGSNAGQTNQGQGAVAVGDGAGTTNQRFNAIAIGTGAGNDTQGITAVAVGWFAGKVNQGIGAVAVGASAGYTSQSGGAVAVGDGTGYTSQGIDAVAVGYGAGRTSQSMGAVAVGGSAGGSSQGQYAVAIGRYAGQNSQPARTTIINASGSPVNGVASQTDSFYVAPIRTDATPSNVLYYNTNTKEVTYGTATGGAGSSLVNGAYTLSLGTDGRTTFPAATVPAHSYGVAGDKAGMVVFDASYIYYCTADYVDNSTNIWKRTAHGAGTW